MSLEVIKALMVMSELYDKAFSEAAATMLARDLEEYEEDKVLHALSRCRKELRQFPTVSDIVSRINPQADPQSQAVFAASEIVQAITKYGWNNADRAFGSMSDLAGRIVRMSGGWPSVCEQLTDRNKTQMLAQWRDLGKAILAQGDGHNDRVRIEGPQSGGMKALSYDELMTKIKEKGGEHGRKEDEESNVP